MAKLVVIDVEALKDREPDVAAKEFFGRWKEAPEPLDWSMTEACTDSEDIIHALDEMAESIKRSIDYRNITLTIDSRSIGDELFSIVLDAATESVRKGTRCVFDLGDGPVEIRVSAFTVSSGPFHSNLRVDGGVSTDDMNRLARTSAMIGMAAHMDWHIGATGGLCTPSRDGFLTDHGIPIGYDLSEPMYRMDEHGRPRAV